MTGKYVGKVHCGLPFGWGLGRKKVREHVGFDAGSQSRVYGSGCYVSTSAELVYILADAVLVAVGAGRSRVRWSDAIVRQ